MHTKLNHNIDDPFRALSTRYKSTKSLKTRMTKKRTRLQTAHLCCTKPVLAVDPLVCISAHSPFSVALYVFSKPRPKEKKTPLYRHTWL